jgi:hypothetical protein
MNVSIRSYLGKRATETILLLILLHVAIAILDPKILSSLLERYLEIWRLFLDFLAKALNELLKFLADLAGLTPFVR